MTITFVSLSSQATVAVGVAGILLNVCLLIVAWQTSTKRSSSMHLFVILRCLIDIGFAFTAAMSALSFAIDSGVIMVVTNGLAKELPRGVTHALADVGVALGCNLPLTPISAIFYRYCLVCRKQKLTARQVCLLVLGVLVTGFAVVHVKMLGFFTASTLSMESQTIAQNLIVEFQAEQPGLKSEQCFYTATSVIYHRIGVAGIVVLAVFCGGVSIYCSSKTFTTLDVLRDVMSPTTLEAHRRCLKVLIMQAAMPLIIADVPIGALELCYYLHMKWPIWFSSAFSVTLYGIPMLNATTVLLMTPAYRRTIREKIGRERTDSQEGAWSMPTVQSGAQ